MKYKNPYLPLWVHLPDGEPRVFEDPDHPGKYRAYIIGSHDVRQTTYCGPDIRIWSAPVEDLSAWRDEGAVFTYQAPNGFYDIMFAPDLVEVNFRDGTRKYYLYPHSRGPGREAMVAVGDSPVGPFKPVNVDENGVLLPGSFIGFDPGVYVEQIDDPNDPDYDIGFRAYVYYGFQKSYVAELDQHTMYTVRPGTEPIEYFVPSSHSYGNLRDPEGIEYPHVLLKEDYDKFNFFEAKSIRKVGNKYLLIFSGYSGPDYGMESTNSSLRYAYADSPLGPWKAGGVLVDSRGPALNQDGSALEQTSCPGHNTHGSLEFINGEWYCFYHRPPRGYGFARQPVVAPMKIDWEEKPVAEGGTVTIKMYDPYAEDGTWTAKASNGHEYTGAQVTSEGFNAYGLDPYTYYSAGIVAYTSNPDVLKDNYDIWNDHMPVEGMKNGDRLGYLHFDFRATTPGTEFNAWITPQTDEAFTVNVWLDGPWENAPWNGKLIGKIEIPANAPKESTQFKLDVTDTVAGLNKKHAIFLTAEGGEGELFDLIGLGFSSPEAPLGQPYTPQITITVNGAEVEIPNIPTASTIENGIVGHDVYDLRVTLPADTKEIPVLDVQATHDDVEIQIDASSEIFGKRVARATFKGLTKVYHVHIAPPTGLGEPVEYYIMRSNPTFFGGVHASWNEEVTGFAITGKDSLEGMPKLKGSVDTFELSDGDNAVEFEIDVAEAGTYEVEVTHTADFDPVSHTYTFNGTHFMTMTYRTGGWLISKLPERVELKEGKNTVAIANVPGSKEGVVRVLILRKVL